MAESKVESHNKLAFSEARGKQTGKIVKISESKMSQSGVPVILPV